MSTHTIHDHFASLASLWEDSVNDNIDEEYDRLVEHLHDCARRAESLKDVKKRLSSKTLELIRQRGISRATGNHQQTSELARLCREAIKEDLKERRAAVMDEAAEAGKSIRKARRNFANYKTEMTSLRRPDETVTASRRAMEKVIYDFYSDLSHSHVYMPPCHLRIGRILDVGQPCEQAGFRRGLSTIDHIHTVTKLIEVSREYKMPLCLTFIDLKKDCDTVETVAVIEALGNQGIPTQ
ncbi:hypothetical protein V3C99_018735 [Haemonchus contortus]